MDPITTGLFVAANFAVGAFGARNKAKAQEVDVKLQVEQAKLQAEEAAFEATKSYRELISYNAALSAMGYGGATGFRGAAATAASTLGRDLDALARKQRFAAITGQSEMSKIRSQQLASTAAAGLTSVTMAKDLGLFAGKDK